MFERLTGRLAFVALGVWVAGCAEGALGEETDADDREVGSGSHALTASGFTMPDAYYGDGLLGCSSSAKKDIEGAEPAEAGTYPVFVYLTGTTMPFNGAEAKLLTSEMAKRGFVAATVEYANSTYPSCITMKTRASCIFSASSANSAITKLCARPKADCGQGIVVSGFSQGANLAALSKNYDGRVRGAYLLGHGNRALNLIDVSSCSNNSATALLPTETRSINGESDSYFGGNLAGVRTQLQAVSGVTCSTATSCLSTSGSGWSIALNGNLADGKADHCYFFQGASSTCSTYSGFDAGWLSGTASWAMTPNLDWLAARVGH